MSLTVAGLETLVRTDCTQVANHVQRPNIWVIDRVDLIYPFIPFGDFRIVARSVVRP